MRKLVLIFLSLALFAASQKLLPNTKILYRDKPKPATTLDEFFTNSRLYLRLRSHYIAWDWDKEDAKRKDNWGYGIGGSLIFKSAWVHGWGATIGFYTSQNPWHMKRDEIGFVKSGKDTFSRYKVAKGDGFGMRVVAQSYLEYTNKTLDFKLGRQTFDSMLVKANDSKMIPNCFEGVSFKGSTAGLDYKLAYFTHQKLRDKTFFHDVITFGKDLDGDGVLEGYEKWANNDDAGVNKALNAVNLAHAGKSTHNRLIITEATTSHDTLTTTLNATLVPGLFGLLAIEPKLRIDMGSAKLVQQLRYIRQIDLGAKDVGRRGIAIANLKGDATGYKNPYSLWGWLFNARIDYLPKESFWWVRLGYSQTGDRADIVDPWRGFPTGGYTRAMAQYNWYANTKSWMGRVVVNLDRAKLIPGLWASLRYEIEDFDDAKPGVQADVRCLNLDLFEKVPHIDGLFVKLRIGITKGSSTTRDMTGHLKADPSFKELRFEINYLL